MQESKLKIISVKAVDQLKYLKSFIVEYLDKNGDKKEWEVVSREDYCRLTSEINDNTSYSDGVTIFATNPSKDKVVLLKEYRVSAGQYLYALPAGLADGNEPLENASIREFKEETGMKFEPVTIQKERYTSVGLSNEKVNIAYGYYSGKPSKKYQEASEDADILIIGKEEAKDILENKEVPIRTALLLQDFFKLNSFLNE